MRATKSAKRRYAENPMPAIQRATAWNKGNLERRREIARNSGRKRRPQISEYQRERRRTNIQAKLASNLRRRLGDALRGRGGYKAGSAVRDLGCSLDEFRAYIEGKFQPGQSWENWGRTGWHLDHIRPLSQFDLTDRIQFLSACHFSNYQPLWAVDNLSKNWRT